MNCYETLFVVKPTLTEEEINTQIDRVKAILEKEGAVLEATNNMGMRKLAYQVEKNSRGYYTVLYFKAEGSFIGELERNLRNNEEVIKFLTVKYSKVKEVAQFNKMVANINGVKNAPAVEASETPVVEEVAVVEETPVAPETTVQEEA
jgi:small subunit ribosomal protein S6